MQAVTKENEKLFKLQQQNNELIKRVNLYKNKIKEMNALIEQLNKHNNANTNYKSNDSHQLDIVYKKELEQCYFEIKMLKEKNDKLNSDITSYTTRVGILDTQISNLQDTIKCLNDKNIKMNDQINKLLLERSKTDNRPNITKND